MSWRERREGERAYERDGWSGRYRNPYDEYRSYDDSRAHRDWDDGYREAERREQERREEREHEERQERERMERQRWERECAEREYYEQMEAQREQEQYEEQCCDGDHTYYGDDSLGGRCYCGDKRYPTGGPLPDEDIP